MNRRTWPLFAVAAASAAAIPLALSLAPAPAGAQSDAPICPTTMPGGSEEITCRCWGPGNSSVWGTDVYTDDSGLCTAAVHAGAIPSDGGVLTVYALPGRETYGGSTRNGVRSSDYGSWRRSIAFRGAGSYESAEMCPSRYNTNGTGWSGTCQCNGVGTGAVWGSGPYTADSDLCRAARHAGVIGPNGGVVRVGAASGRSSYAGSTRNGIQTSSWGSYGASFTVSK